MEHNTVILQNVISEATDILSLKYIFLKFNGIRKVSTAFLILKSIAVSPKQVLPVYESSKSMTQFYELMRNTGHSLAFAHKTKNR